MREMKKDWGPEGHAPIAVYSFARSKYDKEVLFKNLVRASEDALTRNYCAADKCRNQLWEDTPLCKEHAYDMWKKVDVSKDLDHAYALHEYREYTRDADQRYEDALEQQRQEDEALKAEWRRKAEEDEKLWNSEHRPGHIYYLKVGAHIKIGFSTYVPERLKSYPPDSELLAQHPGTPLVERRIHHKFLHLLAHGREWFNPSDEIMRHVRDIHEDFPKDNKNLIT